METNYGYVDKENGYFSSDERKWITKVRKLKEKFPDQVQILAEPESNDGCIYCRLPASWLKIVPKKVLTDKQREKLSERMKQLKGNG